jgi:predicted deacylase
VAASSHSIGVWLLGALLFAGCAKGGGEGNAVGQVWAPDCGLDGQPFELNPSFFAMQPSASVEIIDIVVQRGSDLPSFSDGIAVFIAEPEMLKDSMLGTELDFELLESPVEMTLYLNATCPGLVELPVVYRAVSGTIRFDELYVPWVDNETKETSAVFTNVELVDNQDPEERRARLDGSFRFLFERGMPAQLFQY